MSSTLWMRGESCAARACLYGNRFRGSRALPFVLEKRRDVKVRCIADAIVDYLRSPTDRRGIAPSAQTIAPPARGQTVTRGANLSCDYLVSFRPATRLPIFFSTNDHEHPIACAPLLSHATDAAPPSSPSRSTSGSPELRRAAMLELNDEPKLDGECDGRGSGRNKG